MLGFILLASSLGMSIPEQPIAPNAVEITSESDKSFFEWTKEDHEKAYDELQKLIVFWMHEESLSQHLVYGTLKNHGSSFSFQVAPFVDAGNFLTRFYRQFRVLWRVSFGKAPLSSDEKVLQKEKYFSLFEPQENVVTTTKTTKIAPQLLSSCSKEVAKAPDSFCAFCDEEIITKQQVFEGDKARVLYNYAPLGIGGERLHFLITPKRHAATSFELTKEEYVEAFSLAQDVVATLSKTREIADVHFLYKCGKDAGQTVPHWHLHVIVQLNDLQGALGKLTTFKNMALGGGFPLKKEELEVAVDKYSSEFLSLTNKEKENKAI